MANERGPYLIVGAICERVLVEKDEVPTLVRIVDRVNVARVGQPPPSQMPIQHLRFKLFLSFRAGEATGSGTVALTIETPDGLKKPPVQIPTYFESPDRGPHLIIDLNLDLDTPGLYWFEVRYDGDFLTRIPLRLIY